MLQSIAERKRLASRGTAQQIVPILGTASFEATARTLRNRPSRIRPLPHPIRNEIIRAQTRRSHESMWDSTLFDPIGLAVDSAGNVYVADRQNHRVREIDAAGTITNFAATGDLGSGGDGGPATEASLAFPAGLAVVARGDVDVADMGSPTARRIDTAGRIATLAGTGNLGSAGDGGPATRARLAYPAGVATDGEWRFFVSEYGSNRVRVLTPASYISVELGTSGEHYLLEASEDGVLTSEGMPVFGGRTVLAGTGERYVHSQLESGTLQARLAPLLAIPRGEDGTPNPAQGSALEPVHLIDTVEGVAGNGVATDEMGNVYVADAWGHQIVQVDPAGTVTTLAGTGTRGYSGDGGSATEAQLNFPRAVVADNAGNSYVADSVNHRVQRIDAAGTITTAVGTGERGSDGDGRLATEARLNSPAGVAVDVTGVVYVASEVRDIAIRVARNTGFRVSVQLGSSGESISLVGDPDGQCRLGADPVWRGRQVTAGNGNIYSLVAGMGGTISATYVPKVPILKLAAGEFVKLTRDEAGAWRIGPDPGETPYRHVQGGREYVLELADGQWQVASYTVQTVAGNGDSADGLAAAVSALAGPCSVADDVEHRVRRIDVSGVMEAHVGTGDAGSGGTREVATSTELNGPCGVAVDVAGNLYVADTGNHQVMRVAKDGIATTIAGKGKPGYGGDGGPGPRALLEELDDVALDGIGNVYVAG